MNITTDKFYKTRDGRKVRIYAVDGCHTQSVHGAINIGDGWACETWHANGKYLGNHSDEDIVAEWTDKPDVPWDDYAKWWRWVAMDCNSHWHHFSELPTQTNTGWGLKCPHSCSADGYLPPEHAPKFTGDWKDSLCERPDK